MSGGRRTTDEKKKEPDCQVEVEYFEEDEDNDANWIEYNSISEKLYLHYDECPNVDYYWERGWSNNDDEFWRSDTDGYLGCRNYRQFPTRYRLADYKLSKSLRRVRNRNRDLRTIVRPLRVTPGKIALYEKHYLRLAEKVYEKLENEYRFAKFNVPPLMETCAFLGEKLVASSIFGLGTRAICGYQAFWDLEHPRRSLGILTALLEMEWAVKNKMKYYYLGPFYKQKANYGYKQRFPGLEFYDWDNERWVDKKDAGELLNQKLTYYYTKENREFYLCMFQGVAQGREDIIAAALVGKHALDEKREELDYRAIYLTTDFAEREKEKDIPEYFGSPREVVYEKSEKSLTMRAFYRNGGEFEFKFLSPDWAKTKPLDEETRRIVTNGMQIFYDPQDILKKLKKAVSRKNKRK